MPPVSGSIKRHDARLGGGFCESILPVDCEAKTVKWLGRLSAFLLVISLILVPVGLAVALVVTDRLPSLEGLETQIMIVYTSMVAGVIPLVFVLWSLHIRPDEPLGLLVL